MSVRGVYSRESLLDLKIAIEWYMEDSVKMSVLLMPSLDSKKPCLKMFNKDGL